MLVLRGILSVTLVFACAANTVAQINGFTKPFRTVDLASDESGAIAQLHVQEGEAVDVGQVIASLDDRVQKLQVKMAQHLVKANSALEAARHAYHKRQTIADRVAQLVSDGHASESELIRAELELAIAQAKYLAAEEDAITRAIELEQAQVMLDRRSVTAPFEGIVDIVHKEQGEYLSPARPEIITLIQVDRLLAVFAVPSYEFKEIENRKHFAISFDNGRQIDGTLHSVGVQTDAESATVEVKIELDNSDGSLRAGEQCYLEF